MACYTGVGVMSGTSQDGIDICCVNFTEDVHKGTGAWTYQLLSSNSTTVPYSKEWDSRLSQAHCLSGEDLVKLHVDYGHLMGKTVKQFIAERGLQPHFAASHGHTVFHQPQSGFTFQLGDGETMAAYMDIPLVTNFRNKDVALGGQGAPLVPGAEIYLFPQYNILINLGGIANVAMNGKGFDVCPCNMLLNYLSQQHEIPTLFDEGGKLASRGKQLGWLTMSLNSLEYYKLPPPKTLGREWIEEHILPQLDTQNNSVEDLLSTSVHHIVEQLAHSCSGYQGGSGTQGTDPIRILLTGGGALNTYLVTELRKKLSKVDSRMSVVVPGTETVNYKEALSFAFLGLSCLLGIENVQCHVTGSKQNSVSGSIHLPAGPTQNQYLTFRPQ